VGLDVNCKFAGAQEFEYTKELAVFDLLDIGLYHGWVVSKQDEKAFAAFGHLSYNQIVEKLIAFEEAQQSIVDASGKKAEAATSGSTGEAPEAGEAPSSSSRPGSPNVSPEVFKTINDGMVIKEFLDRTASQLSYEGLLALHEAVRERELAVFFRNSHFSAMMKYRGDLYLLCTDIAFATSHLVWERLDEVDGDTSYCDADFKENTAGSDEAAALAAAAAAQEAEASGADASACAAAAAQSDADAMLAWQMMQEDLQAQQAAEQAALQRAAMQQAAAANAASPAEVPVQGTILGNNLGPGGAHAAGTAPHPNGAAGTATAKQCAKGKKTGKSCVVQ
jgi:hypothetical protein